MILNNTLNGLWLCKGQFTLGQVVIRYLCIHTFGIYYQIFRNCAKDKIKSVTFGMSTPCDMLL